jgi:hypothetical protein
MSALGCRGLYSAGLFDCVTGVALNAVVFIQLKSDIHLANLLRDCRLIEAQRDLSICSPRLSKTFGPRLSKTFGPFLQKPRDGFMLNKYQISYWHEDHRHTAKFSRRQAQGFGIFCTNFGRKINKKHK